MNLSKDLYANTLIKYILGLLNINLLIIPKLPTYLMTLRITIFYNDKYVLMGTRKKLAPDP
jgi:hypothetical protein